MNKSQIILVLISAFFLTACPQEKLAPPEPLEAEFFDNLSSLCGQQFVGKSAYPDDPNHDFAGKKLVATFKSCTNNEIRISFVVGTDHSRTWIISKTDRGLLLKHDHRHEDGTPDEITMYGGYTTHSSKQYGTSYKQYFLADEDTAKLIPAAKTNVWMLEYNPDKKELTYYLQRNDRPRYKAILVLQ